MSDEKKVYTIKLTDITKDVVTNAFVSDNSNQVNFHFRCMKRDEVELSTADFIADIDEEEDGIIETIGISQQGYVDAIKKFKNLIKKSNW